jgi:hypothetical protein
MKNKNDEPNKNANKRDEKFLHSSQGSKKEELSKRKNFRFPQYPVLGQKAEDYLREEANIEDMPDEKDQEDYDQAIAETKKKDGKSKNTKT